MNTKTIMILGARRAQQPVIRAAMHMGLRVVAVDPEPSAPGLAVASAARIHDLADFDSILALAAAERIDGILTLAADYPMPVLARVCAELQLPGPSIPAVALSTNKRLMRDALQRAGVPCPKFYHVSTLEEAKQALSLLPGHGVFKPAMSHGGRGITRVTKGSSSVAIEAAFSRAARETRADGVMIEECVEGPEFSVESICYGGEIRVIAVTDKLTTDAPYFVEMGHNQPSRWGAADVNVLRRTAEKTLQTLGVQDAGGHTEIRLSANGPIVMESAARLGGGFIASHLVPLSTGVDLVGASIRVALGEQPILAPARHRSAVAIRFLEADPGVITAIHGIEEATRMVGVTSLDTYFSNGDRVPTLVDATGRVGHVICTADSPDEAIARAEAVKRQIKYETRSAGQP